MSDANIDTSLEARRRKARKADIALRTRQVSTWLTDGGKGDEPAAASPEPVDPAAPAPSPASAKLFPTVLKLRM